MTPEDFERTDKVQAEAAVIAHKHGYDTPGGIGLIALGDTQMRELLQQSQLPAKEADGYQMLPATYDMDAPGFLLWQILQPANTDDQSISDAYGHPYRRPLQLDVTTQAVTHLDYETAADLCAALTLGRKARTRTN